MHVDSADVAHIVVAPLVDEVVIERVVDIESAELVGHDERGDAVHGLVDLGEAVFVVGLSDEF